MRRVPALSALSLLLVLAGCGSRTPSEESQVRDTLVTFAKSVEGRDYQTLCDKVFAPMLLRGLQQIGLPCEVAMRRSLGRVKNPKLTVGKVALVKGGANAEIRTSADNQPPSSDTIELTKVKGRWQVSALTAVKRPRARPTP